jgi:hypothetical protein
MIAFLMTLIAATALQSAPAGYTGRWTYQDAEESVTIELVHSAQTGRVTGTLRLDGSPAPVEGRVRAADLVIEKLGGLPISVTGLSMVAKLDGANLIVTTSGPGESPETITMIPSGSSPAVVTPRNGAVPPSASISASRGAQPGDFDGRWEVVSDDRTSSELIELSVSGNTITGNLIEVERGYFSNRVSIKSQYVIRGSFRDGTLDVTIVDANAPGKTLGATMFRRSKYLVVRFGENERGYARPGQDVVESAAGSMEAAALERAIAGRVYSVSSQAAGGGAFVGQRVRLALCSDRSIAWDVSDMASAPGGFSSPDVDLGSSVSRRGVWSVVLLAGAPAVRAQWRGTGSSYALTAYFMIRPSANGDSAIVDGTRLHFAGSC